MEAIEQALRSLLMEHAAGCVLKTEHCDTRKVVDSAYADLARLRKVEEAAKIAREALSSVRKDSDSNTNDRGHRVPALSGHVESAVDEALSALSSALSPSPESP